jgi:hypothetical protein
MVTRALVTRTLPSCIVALAIVGTVPGCQIRVGERGGDQASELQRCVGAPGTMSQPCVTDVPEVQEARADWAKKEEQFDATFAPELAAFHAMEADLARADTADLSLADKAEQLRTRFVQRCIAESGWSTDACWNGTFARDITKALARLRLRQGDWVAADAEKYTLERPDLRPTDVKIWRAHGLVCGRDLLGGKPCIPPDENRGPPVDLRAAMATSRERAREQETKVQWHSAVQTITRGQSTAVLTFRPFVAGAADARSCGDPEWQRDKAGNDELVRHCNTEHYDAITEVYPPAVVPLSELGDLKVSKTTDAVVVYSPAGKHAGHVFETWRLTGEVNDRGFRLTKKLMFRGTPVRDARPGYP